MSETGNQGEEEVKIEPDAAETKDDEDLVRPTEGKLLPEEGM